MSDKISCCTLAYSRSTTLEEAMRRIAAAGFTGVDIYTGTPHLDPADYQRKEERKKVKELADSLGLKITGFALNGGRLALNLNFSNPKASVRNRTLRYYRDNIEIAHDVACPAINVLTGDVLHGTTREQGRRWTMEALEELTEDAERKQVILGLHPQILAESPLMITIDDALDMIKELKSKMVKIIFDTSQQYLTNPALPDDIRKARGHLFYVHLNDNDGIHWYHWPPGRGVINWDGLFRALKGIDYRGWFCCQVFSDSPTDVDAWIIESRTYVQQVMKKVGYPR